MGGGIRASNRTNYSKIRSQNQTLERPIQVESNSSGQKKKVFISFHTEDEAMVNLMRHQAENNRFEEIDFKPTTPTEPFGSNWRAQMRDVISRSDVFIVTIGAETHKREAVRWEIQTAYQMEKKVIGVRLHRDENHTVPEQLIRNKAPIIYWNLEDIQNEIED